MDTIALIDLAAYQHLELGDITFHIPSDDRGNGAAVRLLVRRCRSFGAGLPDRNVCVLNVKPRNGTSGVGDIFDPLPEGDQNARDDSGIDDLILHSNPRVRFP